MKPVTQQFVPSETRTITVLRHVTNYLFSTSTTDAAFAMSVVEVYHQRVPVRAARIFDFHETSNTVKDMKANTQLVSRILNRVTRMPADLEEAFVLSMSEEFREACKRDLAERYGLLAVRIPIAEPCEDLANLQRILKETGEAITALGPILADGKIDLDDRPHAKHALQQVNEAQAALLEMSVRITAILPDNQEVSHDAGGSGNVTRIG